MSDHQTRTIVDALAGAEIVRVEELSSSGEWVDITHRVKERPMTTDHIDGAAKVITPVLLRDYGMQYDTSHVTADEFMDLARDIARALAAAGLIAQDEWEVFTASDGHPSIRRRETDTPEHDAAMAAKALREAAEDVRDFADILIEQGDHHVSGCQGQADCAACVSRDLRVLADRIEQKAGEPDVADEGEAQG